MASQTRSFVSFDRTDLEQGLVLLDKFPFFIMIKNNIITPIL